MIDFTYEKVVVVGGDYWGGEDGEEEVFDDILY